MTFENRRLRTKEEAGRLKAMGWTLIGIALITTGAVFFLPGDESTYWLSTDGKNGFYTLSLLFAFLGVFCLGAVSRD